MKTNLQISGIVLALTVTSGMATASAGASGPKACSTTTRAAFTACQFDQLDNFWIETGKCANESDAGDRADCVAEARSALKEGRQECREQRDARDDLCADIGQAPYDPTFEPGDFVNPADIGGSVAPNPWLPLIRGRTLVYQSADETVRVTVTDDVKLIDGVPCAVVRDTVEVNGELAEDTVDWMAQDVQGNVWYCGEATAEYEDGFPVNTDGSFQAGVDGAKPGLLMKAAPAVGDAYRQEFDLDNAEDAAKVVNLNGTATTPAASCAGDCLVTEETTALEPGSSENKYYKPGVGEILSVNTESGERSELVQIIDP